MKKLDKHIWQIQEFLTSEDCEALILQAELSGFQVARMRNMGRNNREVFLDYQEALDKILARLDQCAAENFQVAGVGRVLEFYRYQKGEFVAPHRDSPQEISNNVWSNLTLLIYLNNEFKGGETIFPQRSIKINPKLGTAILFEHSILHEGAKVFQGLKYILRTDVLLIAHQI